MSTLTARPGTAPRTTITAGGAFTGSRQLIRLALRRDRVLIPIWLVIFVLFATSSASATIGLYPDLDSRRSAAAAANGTPALVALYGRVYDETSIGALSLMKLSVTAAAMVAVLAIVLVVRHTRAEEESGRAELVGSTVSGRLAPLTAALVTATATMLLLGVLTAIGMIGAGLPAAGSVAFGGAWAATGISYAAVTAITVQLPNSARTATAISTGVLGVTFLLRAVGDTATTDGARWVSWLSPLGWGQQVRPYAGDRWWVLGVSVVFSVLATAIGYVLAAGRDLGSGLLPDRVGRPGATRWLTGPLALAFRLQRGLLIGWTAGMVLAGLVLGNAASSVEGFADSGQARRMILRLGGQTDLTDAFLASVAGIFGVIVSAFAIQAVQRLHGEESGLRAEPLLSTATTRGRWLAGHLTVAVLGAGWLLLVVGAVTGAGYGAATGDAGQLGRMIAATTVQLPAVLVVTALTVAAFGLLPRVIQLGWAALVVFLLIGEFGPLFELDRRVMDLSPYAHTPRLPGQPFSATPLIWLTSVAVALLLTGFLTFRRRDLT